MILGRQATQETVTLPAPGTRICAVGAPPWSASFQLAMVRVTIIFHTTFNPYIMDHMDHTCLIATRSLECQLNLAVSDSIHPVGCLLEYSTKYVGNEIEVESSLVTMPLDTDECMQLCQRTFGCWYWSFTETEPRKCTLHSAYPTIRNKLKDLSSVSGSMLCAGTSTSYI